MNYNVMNLFTFVKLSNIDSEYQEASTNTITLFRTIHFSLRQYCRRKILDPLDHDANYGWHLNAQNCRFQPTVI